MTLLLPPSFHVPGNVVIAMCSVHALWLHLIFNTGHRSKACKYLHVNLLLDVAIVKVFELDFEDLS